MVSVEIPLPKPLDDISGYPLWSHGIMLVLRGHKLSKYARCNSEREVDDSPFKRNEDAIAQAIIYNSCSDFYQSWLPKGEETTARVLWMLLKEFADACLNPHTVDRFLPSLDTRTFGSAHEFAIAYRRLASPWLSPTDAATVPLPQTIRCTTSTIHDQGNMEVNPEVTIEDRFLDAVGTFEELVTARVDNSGGLGGETLHILNDFVRRTKDAKT